MSTQKIKVFVRCRPLNERENGFAVEVSPEKNEVKVLDRHNSSINSHETKNFYFDHVFAPQARQEDIHKTVVRPLIDQVLLGFNCTVFAYGQTGTGKTYTMEGYRSDENLSWDEDPHCGIIPRAVSTLFDQLQNEDRKFSVCCSFLELYNEDAYDLLSSLDDSTKLRIYDDVNRKGSVIVGGLTELVVKSKEDIFSILERGSAKRQTAATLLNACSSRSHTIFSITVQVRDGSMQGEDLIKIGKLNLVDLAGSENIGRSGAQDIRAREAGNINQALLTLGRVITALVEKRPHIPYRESKLTRLLQDSLGGKTKTSLIATISPSPTDYEDTMNVLEYACRAKNITNNPEINQRTTRNGNSSSEIDRLRKELESLQERHQSEMSEVEYKVRNEVAVEFRREIERIKQSYKDTYEGHLNDIIKNRDEMARERDELTSQQEDLTRERDDLTSKLDELTKERNGLVEERDNITKERDNITKERDRLGEERDRLAEERDKVTKELDELVKIRCELTKERDEISRNLIKTTKDRDQLADQMHKTSAELEAKKLAIKSLEGKIEDLTRAAEPKRVQIRTSEPENLEIRHAESENVESKHVETKPVKRATKVRCKLPDEPEDGYANMTFDEDEIAVPSAKKRGRPVGRKRSINPTITLSGKKKKLTNYDEIIDISPVAARPVTRSRATRTTKRKLDF